MVKTLTYRKVMFFSRLLFCNCSMYKNLMQVNWRYHQKRLGTPWQALDPYHNLRVGADILQECHTTQQDWWASVGCYHAPANPQRADRYRRRVVSRWQRVVSAG